MPKQPQKLQQRAQLITILNKYREVNQIDNSELKKDIDLISTFENKEFIFKTLLQEINSSKGLYGDICSIILLETIENEPFEKIAISLLQDKKIKDDKKFLIMSLMKQKGLDFNYRDVIYYIEDADVLAHNGVKSFLGSAVKDPDVQIDLLDFFVNIPKEEKIPFLNNLQEEFSGDDLANAFSILAQLDISKEESDIILNTLLEIDSPYAIDGLEHILKFQKYDTKTRSKIKSAIKKNIKKNPDFSNKLFIEDGEVFKCHISFVDGKSNFSLVFSRKRKDNTIDTLLATANIKDGIVSCVGFCAIDIHNFTSIVKRLFGDSLAVKITPVALKTLFEHYLNKAIKNKIELPYELIVWKNMLNDVRVINYDISEFINSKLERIKLSKEKVKKFASSKMLETWYFSQGENKYVDKLIDKLEKAKIVDLDKINELTFKMIDEKFLNNEAFMEEYRSKLLIQSYVASLAKLKITSSCAYSLCYDNPYTKLLIESCVDKSIYCYFATKVYELEQENVFRKEKPTNYSKEELEILMAQLEEKWN